MTSTAWVFGVVFVLAVLVSASVGAAGPPWWRVPLVLLDRVPGVDLDPGVSPTQALTAAMGRNQRNRSTRVPRPSVNHGSCNLMCFNASEKLAPMNRKACLNGCTG